MCSDGALRRRTRTSENSHAAAEREQPALRGWGNGIKRQVHAPRFFCVCGANAIECARPRGDGNPVIGKMARFTAVKSSFRRKIHMISSTCGKNGGEDGSFLLHFGGRVSEKCRNPRPNGREAARLSSLFHRPTLHKLDISAFFLYNFALVESNFCLAKYGRKI